MRFVELCLGVYACLIQLVTGALNAAADTHAYNIKSTSDDR